MPGFAKAPVLPAAAAAVVVLATALAMTLAAAGPAAAQGGKRKSGEINNAAEYRACMALARSDPKEGFERAIGWRSLGGGTAADHCAAVALIELEQYGEAARRLERLARTSLEEPPVKAGLWAQAGQAWLLGGKPEAATKAVSAAIGLAPEQPDLYVDRAQAWAARGDYDAAETDLSRALRIAPSRAEVYALRASARRFLDKPEDAMADANTALELDPNNPEALLERGILRRLRGDDKGARADWMTILNGMPDSAAAGPARQNIEAMDLRPEGADKKKPPLR